jgi:hypothetical protein
MLVNAVMQSFEQAARTVVHGTLLKYSTPHLAVPTKPFDANGDILEPVMHENAVEAVICRTVSTDSIESG